MNIPKSIHSTITYIIAGIDHILKNFFLFFNHISGKSNVGRRSILIHESAGFIFALYNDMLIQIPP